MLSPIRQQANCHSTECHGIRRNIKKRESLRFRNFFSEAKKPFFRVRNGKNRFVLQKNVRLPRNETPPTQKGARLSFAFEAFGRAGTSLGSKPWAQF